MLFLSSDVEKCAKEKNIHFSFISVQTKNLNIKNKINRDFQISFIRVNVFDNQYMYIVCIKYIKYINWSLFTVIILRLFLLLIKREVPKTSVEL